jgi:uncharacterized membrane protein YtjA (UPF0391 family)
MPFCPNCGKELDSADRFCRDCGKSIQVAQTSPSQAFMPQKKFERVSNLWGLPFFFGLATLFVYGTSVTIGRILFFFTLLTVVISAVWEAVRRSRPQS